MRIGLGLGIGAFGLVVPTPTLTSATSTYFAGASGGDTVSLAGTGFVPGMTATFGSATVSCTVTSSTAATCTSPSQSAAGAVNVKVTNGGKTSNVLSGGYTYVWDPSLITTLLLWVRGDRGYSGGVWTPIAGTLSSYAPSQATGSKQPTVASSWSNGKSALLFASASLQVLKTASFPALRAQPLSHWMVGQLVNNANSFQMPVDGLTSGNRNAIYYASNPVATPQAYAGTSLSGSGQGTTLTAPFRQLTIFNGGSSQILLNPGAYSLTGNAGADSLDGLTLGSQYDGTNPYNGYLGDYLLATGVLPAGDQSSLATYAKSFWNIN